jgi:anti-sigma regulatory factor (Ser/Thr protein kinase)
MAWEWGLPALTEAVVLVVSELVTNAVRASEALQEQNLPTVQMRLHADHERVLIQVWDSNQQMPHRKQPGLDADGGRGLAIVDAISEACGAYRPEGEKGKVAWAVVAIGGGRAGL